MAKHSLYGTANMKHGQTQPLWNCKHEMWPNTASMELQTRNMAKHSLYGTANMKYGQTQPLWNCTHEMWPNTASMELQT